MRARVVDTTLVARQPSRACCPALFDARLPHRRALAPRRVAARGGDWPRRRSRKGVDRPPEQFPKNTLAIRAQSGALRGVQLGIRAARTTFCVRRGVGQLSPRPSVDNRARSVYTTRNNPSEPTEPVMIPAPAPAPTPANRNEPAATPADLQAAWALRVGGLALRDQIRALTNGFVARPRPSRPARATPERSPPSPPRHRLPSARACA